MLLQGYEIRLDFPWFWYPVSGVGIPLSAPILLLALRAPWSSLMAVAWLAFVGVMLPNWAHGSWGFWQFGYRFVVDAMAATLVLIALAYRHRDPDWLLRGTALFGSCRHPVRVRRRVLVERPRHPAGDLPMTGCTRHGQTGR